MRAASVSLSVFVFEMTDEETWLEALQRAIRGASGLIVELAALVSDYAFVGFRNVFVELAEPECESELKITNFGRKKSRICIQHVTVPLRPPWEIRSIIHLEARCVVVV